MTHESRAAAVLEAVLMGVEPPRASNGNLQILGAWTEEPDTICVVYQGWWYPGIVGLRQHVGSTDWPMEIVVLNILTEDLGEPLGSLVDTSNLISTASCGGRHVAQASSSVGAGRPHRPRFARLKVMLEK